MLQGVCQICITLLLPLIQHFRIHRVLPDWLAVEYAEYVVRGSHRHAIDQFPRHARYVRRSHEICDLQECIIAASRS